MFLFSLAVWKVFKILVYLVDTRYKNNSLFMKCFQWLCFHFKIKFIFVQNNIDENTFEVAN